MKKLKLHPYAQCGVLETEEEIIFVSYTTDVLIVNKKTNTMSCTGLYSRTTRKQIGYFLREYYPHLNYYDVKDAYENGYVIDVLKKGV